MSEGAVTVSSSSPSCPRKTSALVFLEAKTPATVGAIHASATPTALACGRAGFVIGPRMFITVGIPSPLRASAAYFIEGWKTWANRKVIPIRPTSSSTFATGRSRRTPSASRTSAEPDFEVEARLPCLTTVRPVAAITTDAMVEMLTVWARSPPVPTMSIDRAGASTGCACAIIESASASSSPLVTPFDCRATRKPASCTGLELPDITSSIAQAADAPSSSSPRTRRAVIRDQVGVFSLMPPMMSSVREAPST